MKAHLFLDDKHEAHVWANEDFGDAFTNGNEGCAVGTRNDRAIHEPQLEQAVK